MSAASVPPPAGTPRRNPRQTTSSATTNSSSPDGTASAAAGVAPSTTSVADWKSARNGYRSGVPLKSGFVGGTLPAIAKLACVVRCCDQSAQTVA